ncbi:MAG: ABC transporter permease [Dethiobacteria bacterium]|jgi:peptide/nickel transport system permease protein
MDILRGKKRSSSIFRIVEYFLTFLVIISLNFALPRMMPGEPFLHYSGEVDELVAFYSKEQIQYYHEYYGLDRPLHEQYFSYLKDLAEGDLGFSYYYKENVRTIILRRLPWTMFLVISAMGLSIIAGIILGSYSAWHRGKWQDSVLYTALVVFSEIPAFLVGLALLIWLGAGLGLFPLAGAATHFANYDSIWDKIADMLHHAALPVLTLTLSRTGGIYLLVRNSLGTVLAKDYMLTARAKGLKELRIRYVYALRNALMPLCTRIAIQLGALIGGAILAENVFSYPGIGVLMRSAVVVRDYPLIQGIFLVLAVGVMVANMLADLAYKYIDPRTRPAVIGSREMEEF